MWKVETADNGEFLIDEPGDAVGIGGFPDCFYVRYGPTGETSVYLPNDDLDEEFDKMCE